MFYEILLRGDELGDFKGAHVLETSSSLARPIKEGDWPAIITGINEASLAKAASAEIKITELQTELAEVKATLLEHQTLTDQGMAAAGPLIDKVLAGTATAEDKATLAYIFSQFALYSSGREAALKAKRKAELQAEAAAKLAEAESL